MKLTELDLNPREWIPHSGWPITYAELERYYPKAEKILRLPSFEKFETVTLRRHMSPQERALFDNGELKPNILSEPVQEREKLLNHYLTFERQWSEQTAKAYQSFVHTMKIVLRKGYSGKRLTLSGAKLAKVPELIYLLAPRELMPHFLYRTMKAIKNRISGGVTELIVVNYCEQAPNPQSRVYLSHERDRLQMNRLVLDWKVGDEETENLLRLREHVDGYLKKHHIGYLDNTSQKLTDLYYTDASHHIGTTLMSYDPRTGVVDKNCRVHGVSNLYIAGSSVFPTSAYANPTLTIVALAIRLAEHLKRLAVSS